MVMGIDDLVLAVVAKGTSAAVTKLLGELLRRQDQMVGLLSAVQQDVDALLHGPLRTAAAYLAEAGEPGRSPVLVKESLALARVEFMRALGQEHDHYLRSEAALGLSVAWVAVGSLPDSIRYAEVAARELFTAVDDSIRGVGDQQRKSAKWWGSLSRLSLSRKDVLKLAAQYTDLCLRQHELVRLVRHLGSLSTLPMNALSIGVWQQNTVTRTVIPVVTPPDGVAHPPSLPAGTDASYDLIGVDSAIATTVRMPWRSGF